MPNYGTYAESTPCEGSSDLWNIAIQSYFDIKISNMIECDFFQLEINLSRKEGTLLLNETLDSRCRDI